MAFFIISCQSCSHLGITEFATPEAMREDSSAVHSRYIAEAMSRSGNWNLLFEQNHIFLSLSAS